MKVASLFSGIGGIEYGLHKSGFQTELFCEVLDEAQDVLRKNFPNTEIFSDVRKLKNIALSIGTIFHFIIKAEFEWDNIKRIAYGKRYNLTPDRINSMLVME